MGNGVMECWSTGAIQRLAEGCTEAGVFLLLSVVAPINERMRKRKRPAAPAKQVMTR